MNTYKTKLDIKVLQKKDIPSELFWGLLQFFFYDSSLKFFSNQTSTFKINILNWM